MHPSYERCGMRIESSLATTEDTTRSGGRPPAVGVTERTLRVITGTQWQQRLFAHGWLTLAPPGRTMRVRCAICCAQKHIHKSGEPVVGAEGGEPMAPVSRNPIGAGIAEPIRLGNHVQLGLSAGLQTNSIFPPLFWWDWNAASHPHAIFRSATTFGVGSSNPH